MRLSLTTLSLGCLLTLAPILKAQSPHNELNDGTFIYVCDAHLTQGLPEEVYWSTRTGMGPYAPFLATVNYESKHYFLVQNISDSLVSNKTIRMRARLSTHAYMSSSNTAVWGQYPYESISFPGADHANPSLIRYSTFEHTYTNSGSLVLPNGLYESRAESDHLVFLSASDTRQTTVAEMR